MNTNNKDVVINDIEVRVIRKDIKNIHLGVYPPDGKVRIAVPLHINDDSVRLAVISKLSWIKKKQLDFLNQPRQSAREFVSGECHYFMGTRYRLDVIERSGCPMVYIKNASKLVLETDLNSSRELRASLLDQWYRKELKKVIPALIQKWEPIVEKSVTEWGIKKMKTKWGTCNSDARRIWLNLELAKKPIECLEYVIVHEMVHFFERSHNENFKAHMDRFFPKWRFYKSLLNALPLDVI